MYHDIVDSPLGQLFIGVSIAGIHHIGFLPEQDTGSAWIELLECETGLRAKRDKFAAAPIASQLIQYFVGERPRFELPLAPSGTKFQKQVWGALSRVSYGRTSTYGEIACDIGRPLAARAVGGAIHRNPLVIVIPCHRILGSDGSLTGYEAGLHRKAWLLNREAEFSRSINEI